MARITDTPLKRPAMDITVSPKSSRKNVPGTPSSRPKRVRFSDPGPSTTGLTPFMQRTSFSGSSPPPEDFDVASPRRRKSAPQLGLARQLYSRLDTQANHDNGVELFVAPLKDVLSDRVKRRMARRGLSDEVNSWVSSKRETQKLKREVRRLSSLMEKKDLEMDISPRIVDDSDIPDVPDLTDESFEESDIQDQSLVLYEPTTPTNQSIQTIIEAADIDALTSAYEEQNSALIKARLSLESLIPSDPPLPVCYSSPDDVLSIDVSSPLLSTPSILTYFTSTITDLHTSLSKTHSLLTSTKIQESNLRAQFNNALENLEQTRAKNDSDVKFIKKVAREKFQEMNSKSVQDDATIAQLQTNITVREDKISDLNLELDEAVASTTQLHDTIATLKSDNSLHESTISKLNAALARYRLDITSLEDLISQMEQSHSAALLSSANELKDTRALALAETRGRRTAEAALTSADLRLKSLSVTAEELRSTVHAKQSLIREMESVISSLQDEAQSHVQSLGTLNVRISFLESERQEYDEKLKAMHDSMRAEVNSLLDRLDAHAPTMSPETPSRLRALENLILPFHESPSKSRPIVQAKPVQMRTKKRGLGLSTPRTPRSAHVPSSVTVARGHAGKKEGRVDSSSPMGVQTPVSDFWNTPAGLSMSFPPIGFGSEDLGVGEVRVMEGGGRVLSPVA